jgi:mannosyltransferase OCH1-like enzyme
MNLNKIKWLYSFFIISTNLLASTQESLHPNYMYVEFDQSMSTGNKLYLNKYQKNRHKANFITKLKKLYEKNNLLNIKINNNIKIPKIIHQIWVGPKPLPEFYKKLANSWIKKHPDWKYRLWTDKEVAQINLTNQKIYDKAKSYS